MSRKIELVSGLKREPLPGIEMLVTDAAREVADRTQFRGGIGHHVYVNGFDLARVESAGLRDPRIIAAIKRHGWYSPNDDLPWFRQGDTDYRKHTLADAVVAVIEELESSNRSRQGRARAATPPSVSRAPAGRAGAGQHRRLHRVDPR